MNDRKPYSRLQLTTLVVLRLLIGWHLMYEGLAKLFTPNWSSVAFLRESQWIMSGFADWITSHSGVLHVVDFLNTWGLIAIGLGLILGLFSRTAAIFGAALLLVYYLNNPPLIGISYSIPSEGNYLIVSKTLIEAVALFLLAIFPTSRIVGLDLYVSRIRNQKNG